MLGLATQINDKSWKNLFRLLLFWKDAYPPEADPSAMLGLATRNKPRTFSCAHPANQSPEKKISHIPPLSGKFFPTFGFFKTVMRQKFIIFFFSVFLLGSFFSCFAQNTVNYPFYPHEDLKLKVYYNLGPIWVYAGYADLKTDTITYNGIPSLHFVASGFSLKKYAFIFKLEDHYQAIVSQNNFKPLFYEKNTLEGGYYIHNIYHFHWKKKFADIHTEATRHPVKDTILPLEQPVYDVLTATYYLRIINTDTLSVGDTLPVPLIVDGKPTTYYIVYAGKGTMEHKKKKISCDVYKAVILNSTFFSDTDPLVVYVTADKNRYPIYVEANIIVGSVKVFLRPYMDFKPKFIPRKRK